MVRKSWSDTELSAYLDGQLAPRKKAELATDLTRDAALQRRLDELRRTVALLQTYPLREAPRNYLLTPAMVRDPQRQIRRRPTLLWLRMATALSTAAFVIVVGLQLVGGGMMNMLPAAEKSLEMQEIAMEQPTEAPAVMEAESLGLEEEASPEATAIPTAAPTEAPAATAEVVFGSEKEAEPESTTPPAGEIVEETSTPMADRAASEGVQLTATAEMTLGATLPLPVVTESVGLCSAEDGAEECDGGTVWEQPPQEEPAAPLPDASVKDETQLTAEGQAGEEARARGNTAWQWWTALLLGICALGLGGATWWFSRRR
ncbi:MAG: hypothetical protein U9R05_04470 [Chloroflexota bacterium]|nr:hypothetical protein [Chloroflexota bacterium]